MASEAAKVVVPESVLRKRKREDLWAVEKKEKAAAERKKAGENRKVIFARAKQYAEEYDAQVRSLPTLDRSASLPPSRCSFMHACLGIHAHRYPLWDLLGLIDILQNIIKFLHILYSFKFYKHIVI
jgi:hypothetical protein